LSALAVQNRNHTREVRRRLTTLGRRSRVAAVPSTEITIATVTTVTTASTASTSTTILEWITVTTTRAVIIIAARVPTARRNIALPDPISIAASITSIVNRLSLAVPIVSAGGVRVNWVLAIAARSSVGRSGATTPVTTIAVAALIAVMISG
jgi:hypothetical protein